LFHPISWLFDIAGKAFIKRAANILAPNPLVRELTKAAETWAKEEAHGIVEADDPDSLLSQFFTTSLEELTRRDELVRAIEENRPPTAEQWLEALLERWESVRVSAGENARPLFRMEPNAAEALLRELAKRLFDACSTIEGAVGRRAVLDEVRSLRAIVTADHATRYSVSEARAAFVDFSGPLLKWPSRLVTGDCIGRQEFDTLMKRIEDERSSTTILLGARGSGKSVLLATIANAALDKGWTMFGIKADRLTETKETEIENSLGVTTPLPMLLRASAAQGKTLLIVDQLDAVAEIADRSAERLNFLLNLIQRTSDCENLHIVVSSRHFEFQTDARLRTIDAQTLELNLPPWEDVAPILTRAGHRPDSFSEVLRGLLRNPWALNLYLQIAKADEEFTSLTELMEAFWNADVLAAPDVGARRKVIDIVIREMTREEQLSIPASLIEDEPEAAAGLLKAELFVKEGVRVSFRHQTFYEFLVARQLGTNEDLFLAHVLERQDGLFVRPTVAATLIYMRETNRAAYVRAINALLTGEDIRLHIRSLVVDLLASQEHPSAEEIAHVVRFLSKERFIARILLAASRSLEWFREFRNQKAFLDLLGDQASAATALGILVSAVQQDRDQVFDLVRDYWLTDPAFDHLTASVIAADNRFTDVALQAAKTILGRTPELVWLIEQAAGVAPTSAIQMLAREVERMTPEPLLAAARANNFGDRRKLEQSLRNDARYELEQDLATKLPAVFVKEIWPWLTKVCEAAAEERMGQSYSYIFDLDFDVGPTYEVTIVDSLIPAARAFAERDPDGFAAFVESEKDADVMALHIVLASGLEVIASTRPDFVMRYLLEDGRRLSLGTSADDWTETTVALITAAYARASADLRRQLDQAILSLDRYAGRPFEEEKADKRATWNREHRLILLQALPAQGLDPILASQRDELAHEFPNPGKRGPLISGGMVGPRVTAEELHSQSEEEWIALFDEITDTDTESFHHLQRDIDIARAGGVHVQAHAVTDAVLKAPERGQSLLARLRPEAHQRYATAVLEALGKSMSADKFMPLVKELDMRGFRSNDFRAMAGGIIEDVAKRSGGLADEDVTLLQSWLDEYPPDNSQPDEHLGEANEPKPIIVNPWGTGMSYGIPNRLQLMCAIAAGLLSRATPATSVWLRIVEREIGRDASPTFWWWTLNATIPAMNASPDETNKLLGRLFDKVPSLIKDTRMLFLIGMYVPRLEPERLRRWVEPLESVESFALRQAFGEIITLTDLWHGDKWTALQIERAIGDHDCAVLTGVGFASRYLWAVPRRRELFARALSAIAADVPRCPSAAVVNFMNDTPEEPLDFETESIIRAILANPACARDVLEQLAQLAETMAGKAPSFAADVLQRILDLVGSELTSGPLRLRIAGELTSAALTLHRQSDPTSRAKGLALFERLIELDVREADAALEILDRRPTQRGFGYPSRRRYRRSARHRRRRPTQTV
jgi:hypothetical protein